MSERIFFVSDTHFKYDGGLAGEAAKRASFFDFIEGIRGASRLYLLGDTFDFWFEYRSVIPRYYRDILGALETLRRSGTEIYLAGGNHDYWLGPYLSDTLGFTVLPPLSTHELQGLKITMTHGDDLLPGDRAYKALKTVTRSRAAIALARAVHPDLLYAFARRFSRASKGFTEKKTESAAKTLLAIAPQSFFRWDNNVFVMGHIHYPCLERFGPRIFVILGDWEKHCSYLELAGGELSLRFYRPGGKTLSENR